MFGTNSQMVSWKDYEGVEGFGVASMNEVDQLNKALTAGQSINPPGSVTAGDGFALRVESLEDTLKNVTYKMEHIRLWKAIPKKPAYNTVEEFNQIQSYGDNEFSGWIAEGDLPNEDDSKFERKFSVVKFLGTTRKVTHVMSLVQPAHGDNVALETVNGTMHLLKILEKALFEADSSLSALQFDGYKKLITDNAPATNVIDLRGQPLSEDIVTDACLTMFDAPNYGIPTHFHLNPKVKADFVKAFFPKERHATDTKNMSYVGLDVKGFTSPAGDVMFEPNVFISDGGAPPAAAVGPAATRPDTPSISTGATTPVEATAQFGADDAGDYFYKVVAVNQYGHSVAVAVDASAIAIAAGDKMTFGVTPGGSTTVDYYALYRSKKGGAVGNQRLIMRVANGAGAGEQTINDLNAYLPYTYSGYIFQQNLENMSFKQLAPMVKIPLATIDTKIRWMQLLYGVPVLYTPGKNILFTNIGRSEGYVGAS
jgi:hypothetical protein